MSSTVENTKHLNIRGIAENKNDDKVSSDIASEWPAYIEDWSPLSAATAGPRLELRGAALLIRLVEQVKQLCEFADNTPLCYWRDSTVVLSWLSDHQARCKTYGANRVSGIEQLLLPLNRVTLRQAENQWTYSRAAYLYDNSQKTSHGGKTRNAWQNVQSHIHLDRISYSSLRAIFQLKLYTPLEQKKKQNATIYLYNDNCDVMRTSMFKNTWDFVALKKKNVTIFLRTDYKQ
uniref:Uncharacterized protein n=1 Tax=Glossina austeni TaxID=7395 RepID=A0A1A9UWQ8_GLOAU